MKSLPFSPTTTVCVAAAVEVEVGEDEATVVLWAAATAAPVRSKAEDKCMANDIVTFYAVQKLDVRYGVEEGGLRTINEERLQELGEA